jgi:hypothetical protein
MIIGNQDTQRIHDSPPKDCFAVIQPMQARYNGAARCTYSETRDTLAFSALSSAISRRAFQ